MEFWLLAALLVKHWVCDFPLQRAPYLYAHKGTYGHGGGIAHAYIHSIGTGIVLILFTLFGEGFWGGAIILLSTLDGVLHYHIDFAKVQLTRRFRWSEMLPDAVTQGKHRIIPPHLAVYSQNYFEAIGVDQLLHHLTYVLIVVLI